MKTVMISGAGGFIGSALALELAKRGQKVYALIYSEQEKSKITQHENIVVVMGNLEHYEAVLLQINETIEVFYHLAWKGISAADYKNIDVQKDNLLLSIHAAKLAMELNCSQFVFIGSNQEYLKDTNSVDGKASYSSIYGACKAACREICSVMSRGKMQFCATAFTNVFGWGDYSKRTANVFISKLLKGESLDLIEGKNLYDWTYIDDAVGGIIAVGEKGINNRQYYIGSRDLKTFREIIEEVRAILCPSACLNFGKYNDTSYTDYAQFNLEALLQDTGYVCGSNFRESVLKTAEWVKQLDV